MMSWGYTQGEGVTVSFTSLHIIAFSVGYSSVRVTGPVKSSDYIATVSAAAKTPVVKAQDLYSEIQRER